MCFSSSRLPRQAQIYVNGTKVGEHIGGYNGFSIDITSAIKTGDNVVAVRLNNNWNAQIPPFTGDHTFQGGIYRDCSSWSRPAAHHLVRNLGHDPHAGQRTRARPARVHQDEVQNNRSAAVKPR